MFMMKDKAYEVREKVNVPGRNGREVKNHV